MFGLENRDLVEINLILSKYPEIENVLIYGSRAKGNYKIGSDVDIAIKGRQINNTVVNEIEMNLNEETFIPYFFDVVHYESLTNDELIKHIDKFGKELPIIQ